MAMHFTYQTKNLVNNKTYVGVHSTDNLNDGYLGSGKLLKRAIRKYGKDNFVRTELCFFDTIDDAYNEEYEIVDKAWVSSPNNYNLRRGGKAVGSYSKTINVSKGKRHSDIVRSIPRKYVYLDTITNTVYPTIKLSWEGTNKDKMKYRTYRAQVSGENPNKTGVIRIRKEVYFG